jgi:hypothetical protein
MALALFAPSALGQLLFEGNPNLLVSGMDENNFYVYDRVQPADSDPMVHVFRFGAALHNGRLIFSVDTYSKNGQRSPHLFAAELFEKMIRHFQGLQQPINVIQGEWLYGSNLQAFNERILAGDTREKAALATWTGRQAIRFDFTQPYVTSAQGTIGHYTEVRVDFYPSSATLPCGKPLNLREYRRTQYRRRRP